MDLSLTALSLSQGEIEFLSLVGVDDVGGEDTFELSLVGQFLTDRSINFNFMRDRLSHLWRLGKVYVFMNSPIKGISLNFSIW